MAEEAKFEWDQNAQELKFFLWDEIPEETIRRLDFGALGVDQQTFVWPSIFAGAHKWLIARGWPSPWLYKADPASTSNYALPQGSTIVIGDRFQCGVYIGTLLTLSRLTFTAELMARKKRRTYAIQPIPPVVTVCHQSPFYKGSRNVLIEYERWRLVLKLLRPRNIIQNYPEPPDSEE